jgi:hypothetical protein
MTTQLYVQGDALNNSDGVLQGIRDTAQRNSVIVPWNAVAGSAIGELSAINRLIVAEEDKPVERRYSFPVGIFTREVKAPRSSSDLGKGQRRERDPHGHDTVYLTFPCPGQPRIGLGRGGRGSHPASVPDL